MKAVERFLEENVRNDSNIVIGYYPNGIQQYYPWIPLRYARKIGKLAREETIKEVCEWLNSHYRDYMHNPTGKQLEAFFGMINNLKEQFNIK